MLFNKYDYYLAKIICRLFETSNYTAKVAKSCKCTVVTIACKM